MCPQVQWKVFSNPGKSHCKRDARDDRARTPYLRFYNTNVGRSSSMTFRRKMWLGMMGLLAAATVTSTPATAQQPSQKPNIMFIMGDDIGIMQPSIYHQGFMVGETPNIDRIGQEGAKFMDYYAMQSCTSGRNAFFTGIIRCALAWFHRNYRAVRHISDPALRPSPSS